LFQCFAIVAVHSQEALSSEITSTASTEDFSTNSREVPTEGVEEDDDDDGEDGEERESTEVHKLAATSLDELAKELEEVSQKLFLLSITQTFDAI
jgi:hypothetical protein